MNDYSLTAADASTLCGATVLAADLREFVLRRYAEQRGPDALLRLFVEFIGLANSVVANNRVMAESIMLAAGVMHPDRNEDAPNLPTIQGALLGVRLAARAPQAANLCGGCAYRLGTPANQSPVTTADADYVRDNSQPFMCHEELNERGDPLRVCRGHALASSAEARAILGAEENTA